jgi:hypothetical protein
MAMVSAQKPSDRTLPVVVGITNRKMAWVRTFLEAAGAPLGIVLTIFFSVFLGVGFRFLLSQNSSPGALVPVSNLAEPARTTPVSAPPSPTAAAAEPASAAPVSSPFMTAAAAEPARTTLVAAPPLMTAAAAEPASVAPVSAPPFTTAAAAEPASAAPVSALPATTTAAVEPASAAPVSTSPATTTAAIEPASAAPVSARPFATAVTAEPDRNEAAALLAKGRAKLSNGDVAGARVYFRRAAEHNDPQAALALGETYDPAVLKHLGVIKFNTDVALAQEWYRRAADLGSAAAISRLDQLSKTAHK